MSKFNGVNSEVYNSKNSELQGGVVRRIKIDLNGMVWLCTSSGLYKYSNAWIKYDLTQSIIAQGQSLEVFSDGKQNVWLENSHILYSIQKITS